jgi:hypothetical protein
VGKEATSTFVNAKGAQRKELIGKLKGLLAQRLSEEDKPPTHAELAQKTPIAGKPVAQGSHWRELKAEGGRLVHVCMCVCVCVCVCNPSTWKNGFISWHATMFLDNALRCEVIYNDACTYACFHDES